MTDRRLAALALALALLAPNAKAQTPTRCALDTTAAWYRKQQAWVDDSKRDWSNDSLRTLLVRAAGLDANPALGGNALLGYEVVGAVPHAPSAIDSAALATLRELAKSRASTWPTKSVVGAAGVRAVWVLAGRDSALAPTILHRMMEAGPEESPPAAVAILEDRVRLKNGRKQIYGTQLVRGANGSVEIAPVEDPKHVDLRRDAAGLPPLELSLCAARRDSAG